MLALITITRSWYVSHQPCLFVKNLWMYSPLRFYYYQTGKPAMLLVCELSPLQDVTLIAFNLFGLCAESHHSAYVKENYVQRQ